MVAVSRVEDVNLLKCRIVSTVPAHMAKWFILMSNRLVLPFSRIEKSRDKLYQWDW